MPGLILLCGQTDGPTLISKKLRFLKLRLKKKFTCQRIGQYFAGYSSPVVQTQYWRSQHQQISSLNLLLP